MIDGEVSDSLMEYHISCLIDRIKHINLLLRPDRVPLVKNASRIIKPSSAPSTALPLRGRRRRLSRRGYVGCFGHGMVPKAMMVMMTNLPALEVTVW